MTIAHASIQTEMDYTPFTYSGLPDNPIVQSSSDDCSSKSDYSPMPSLTDYRPPDHVTSTHFNH